MGSSFRCGRLFEIAGLLSTNKFFHNFGNLLTTFNDFQSVCEIIKIPCSRAKLRVPFKNCHTGGREKRIRPLSITKEF